MGYKNKTNQEYQFDYYLENKYRKQRLAATRHAVVALELSSGECGAAIQPGTSWALAALDRPPNGRIADLSAKSKD